MARGGARPGAGRKKSSLTKRTREIAEAEIDSGKATPLEVMLRAMREHFSACRFDQAAAIAKDAAPYMHPKLAAIEHTGRDGAPVALTLEQMITQSMEPEGE